MQNETTLRNEWLEGYSVLMASKSGNDTWRHVKTKQLDEDQSGLSSRYVLHVGCGPASAKKLHPVFRAEPWKEVRLDIDSVVRPDIVSSVTDMSSAVSDGTFDAVWSSHNIEHLYSHEVPAAFAEFRRVLRSTGFVLICCPDIQAVALAVAEGKIDEIAYSSAAGPITPLDMIFGFGRAVAAGNKFMAHHTAFSQERLARLLLDGGFCEVRTLCRSFDLWCVAALEDTDLASLLRCLYEFGLDFQD